MVLYFLDVKKRSDYLFDISKVGGVINEVCHPMRINYSIYGNTDAFLYAHIFPRYEWEAKGNIPKPVLIVSTFI
jgi:diadenosine tetraphosphate (Ap4A) HIT family hydrolase